MAITNIGKTPATITLEDQSMMLFFNDFVKYEVDPVTISTSDSGEGKTFTGVGVPANYRCLMWARSAQYKGINPVRYVPMIEDLNFKGNVVNPLFEAINPTIEHVEKGSAFMTFWTNFSSATTEYDPLKVYKFEQDDLENAISTDMQVYRALCGCTVQFRRYYITGGVTQSILGSAPADVDEEDRETYEIIPMLTKPHIMHMYKTDYPIVDFNTGGSSSEGGFRRHDHSDNSLYSGGYAFAVFHPGTATPQKPWEIR